MSLKDENTHKFFFNCPYFILLYVLNVKHVWKLVNSIEMKMKNRYQIRNKIKLKEKDSVSYTIVGYNWNFNYFVLISLRIFM